MIWRLGLLGKVKGVMPSILAARLPGRVIGLWNSSPTHFLVTVNNFTIDVQHKFL